MQTREVVSMVFVVRCWTLRSAGMLRWVSGITILGLCGHLFVGPRPWKPAVELQGALDRGDLSNAIMLAHEVAEDKGRPIDLSSALAFLPLVATQQPDAYDRWATPGLCAG